MTDSDDFLTYATASVDNLENLLITANAKINFQDGVLLCPNPLLINCAVASDENEFSISLQRVGGSGTGKISIFGAYQADYESDVTVKLVDNVEWTDEVQEVAADIINSFIYLVVEVTSLDEEDAEVDLSVAFFK